MKQYAPVVPKLPDWPPVLILSHVPLLPELLEEELEELLDDELEELVLLELLDELELLLELLDELELPPQS